MSVTPSFAPGNLVAKAAQNIPQTATSNLYAVSGTVLVTGLLGVVTTVIGSTATTLSIGVTGSNTAVATASAITSKAVGTVLSATAQTAGVGGALTVGGPAFVQSPPYYLAPFIIGVGTANITWTTSASTTGQIQWYLWYVPIDSGAAVS